MRLRRRNFFIGGIIVIVLGIFAMSPVPAAEMKIPGKAKEWKGHSYMLYEKTLSFADAEEYCEKKGGHLAVISSAEENKMLTNYISKQNCAAAMIGLYDENGSNGTWDIWVTGEKVTYKNWGSGQPDWIGQKICVLNSVASSTYGWEIGEWDNGWDGDYYFICEWDGISQEDIKDAYVQLSKKSYTYNGKNKKPSVTVKVKTDKKWKKLKKGTDYKVSYSFNKEPGMASVQIDGIGKYTGCIIKNFEIVPRVPKSVAVKNKKSKKVQVTWKKRSEADSYEIEYSTSKKFNNSVKIKISSEEMSFEDAKNVPGSLRGEYMITSLTKKTYYVRVRSWKNGQYSEWSRACSVKIKK